MVGFNQNTIFVSTKRLAMTDIYLYTEVKNIDHAVALIQDQYEAGHEYFHGRLGQFVFKIRMNKGHGMNDQNNEDKSCHVLSLVDARNVLTIDRMVDDRMITEKSVHGKDINDIMDMVYFWLRNLDWEFN